MIKKYKMVVPFPTIHDCVIDSIELVGKTLVIHYKDVQTYDFAKYQNIKENLLNLYFKLPENDKSYVEIQTYHHRRFRESYLTTEDYSLSDFIELYNRGEYRLETLEMYSNGYGILVRNAIDSLGKCDMFLWTNEVGFEWLD